MNHPSTAREALIAEAIGDVAQLIERVDAVMPALEETRQALVLASAELAGQVSAFERRMAAIAENAKIEVTKHIVRRTDEVARRSLDDQTRAMSEAARKLFETEVGPTLQRLATPLQRLVDGLERPWEPWLTHAATAIAASAATWALALYIGVN